MFHKLWRSNIIHRQFRQISLAVHLIHCPRLPHVYSEEGTESEIFGTEEVDNNFPVTAAEIPEETLSLQRTLLLKRVCEPMLFG